MIKSVAILPIFMLTGESINLDEYLYPVVGLLITGYMVIKQKSDVLYE